MGLEHDGDFPAGSAGDFHGACAIIETRLGRDNRVGAAGHVIEVRDAAGATGLLESADCDLSVKNRTFLRVLYQDAEFTWFACLRR